MINYLIVDLIRTSQNRVHVAEVSEAEMPETKVPWLRTVGFSKLWASKKSWQCI